MDNANRIWNWFWERIGNDFGCAGLLGNFAAESALRPDNLQNSYESALHMTDREYTDAVDNGTYTEEMFCNDGAGFGLNQATYPSRKQMLYRHAKETGKSIGDLGMQLEYIWSELGQREYRNVLNTLLNAKSVKEASDAVLTGYEKPANQSEKNKEARAAMSQKYYDEFASQGKKRELTIYKRLFYDSECFDAATHIIPAGVQVHSTGANNPWLKRYVQPDDGRIGVNTNNNSHNRPGLLKCGSAYIGKQADGTVAVYQALPFDYKCWLSGSGKKGNANEMGYLGFEICEDGRTDKAYFDNAVMDKSVLLTAYWCQEYGIDVDKAVRDHAELAKAGLASDHVDIGHWLENFGLTMDDYRAAVKDALKDGVKVTYIDCDEVSGLYMAKAVNPGKYLNLRSGPSTKYASVARIPQGGIVTVLDDSNTEWWYVYFDGKKGYAMSQYLEKIDDPPEPGPGPEPEPPAEMIEIPREIAELWRDFALSMYKTLDERLTVDSRSGNVSNIDYQ